MVIGTLEPSWLDLELDDRRGHADRMSGALGGIGVRVAMFFDEQRRLHVHCSNGRIRYVNELQPLRK